MATKNTKLSNAKLGNLRNVNLKSNKMIFAAILALAVIAGVAIFSLLNNIYQTETYYVLSNDVSTRTQIAPDMLEPIVATVGTAPKAAKTIGDVQGGYLFSKYPLMKGDILTDSNVGGFEDISTGVPDSWVVTTFSVGADSAVGGRITRGVYFDMMVVDKNGSYYPFINVLCLDTSVSLGGASNANAVNTDEAKAGQTSQYTIGMPPADAAKLSTITDGGGSIKLLLSPRQNEYQRPSLEDYNGVFKYNQAEDGTKDMGKGTDYTFTPVKRDSFGRPSEKADNCSQGNAKLSDEECKKAASEGTTTTNTESTATASESATTTTTPQPATTPSN